LPLVRLLSASLPVGAFAYSRGLETAVEAGWVTEARSVEAWVFGVLEQSFTTLDGALFLRMMAALEADDVAGFQQADDWLAAGRESREFQLEDLRTAEALLRLLADLDTPAAARFGAGCRTFPGAFAIAAHNLAPDVAPDAEAALAALMWGFCDAQVAAAIRLGAIGQTDGQRLLCAAPAVIGRCVARAAALGDDEIGNVSVLLAIGSAMHETQASRLFRS
jgi:urease accessory protein